MMGRKAAWLAYTGEHDEVDRSSTLLFFTDPVHSGEWFVRTEPYAVVNPSFAFFEPLVLEPGDKRALRYRLVIGNGRWDRERIEDHVRETAW